MKLSISNIAWDSQDDSEIYKFLKNNNIKYLEIAPSRIIDSNPYYNIEKATNISKKLKEKYNLEIISMQSIWYQREENMFTSIEDRNILFDYTKKAIDFACSIGCHNLVFGCPKNRNMSDISKNYKEAINFFNEIGIYALSKGVVIAIEANPKIYNTNFLNTTIEALEFVKQINLDSIKINYDLGTVIENKESLEVLKENISYINHIHISEPNLEVIKKRDLHIELFKILKDSNYNKSISIEMKKTNAEKVVEILNYIIEVVGDVYGV